MGQRVHTLPRTQAGSALPPREHRFPHVLSGALARVLALPVEHWYLPPNCLMSNNIRQPTACAATCQTVIECMAPSSTSSSSRHCSLSGLARAFSTVVCACQTCHPERKGSPAEEHTTPFEDSQVLVPDLHYELDLDAESSIVMNLCSSELGKI